MNTFKEDDRTLRRGTGVSSVREDFMRDGYAVVRGVLRAEDFTEVQSEYDALLRRRSDEWRTTRGLKGGEEARNLDFQSHLLALAQLESFNPGWLSELDLTLPHQPFSTIQPDAQMHAGPAVLGLMRNPRILDVVSELVGDEISASPNQHIRLKLPVPDGTDGFGARRGELLHAPTMWHQDAMTQMPESDETDLVTCWVPQMDVDENVGCLLMVPGRHNDRQLLPWPIDPETRADLEAHAVPVPVKRGDLILLHKRTPHGSTVNQTSKVRWSFDFRYYPTLQPSDRPWFPSVVVRSISDPASAETPAEAWQAAWRAAREQFVASGEMVPGRRDFSELVAKSLIERWERGDFPRVAATA